MKFRGYAALVIVCLGLLASDICQRFVIAPWVALRPSRRLIVLGKWQHLMARLVLTSVSRIGGAKIPSPPIAIPAEPGQLILMNHQSLLDIPLVVRTVVRGYPRIVTRKRYSRSIPLISHMARLYQYPVVDPSANTTELRKTLDHLEQVGRESEVPIVVFPEGSRSRDGRLLRFKPGGLTRLLSARGWTVHLLVADGFWKAGRFQDVAAEMGKVQGRMVYAGSLEWEDPTADPTAFIREAHRIMAKALADLRANGSAA